MFNNFPSQFFNDEFLCAFFFRFDVEGFWGKKRLSAQTVGKNTKDTNNLLVLLAINKKGKN